MVVRIVGVSLGRVPIGLLRITEVSKDVSLFSCARGWEIVFVDLCVVLINLWDSFSQVWSSVVSIVAQGVPVVGVGVEVFVYSFALLGRPSFFFTKSEERVSSAISRIVFVDFLDSAVVLCKAKTSCV